MKSDSIDKFLEYISNHGYTKDNSLFLEDLSKFLAKLLNVNYVLIDKYSIDTPEIATIECFYSKKSEAFFPKETYLLKNTPCQRVIDKNVCSYNKDVLKFFPKDKILIEEDVESYFGTSLWSLDNKPIGILAIMHNHPINNAKEIERLLQIAGLKIEKVLEKIIFNEKIKYKEKDLQESETKLSVAQRIAKLGSFSINVSDSSWECSSILNEIVGIDANFVKNLEGLLSIVHPEDRNTVFIDIQDTINDKISSYDKEYRIVRINDNEMRWVHTLGILELDAAEKPLRIIGTMQDITESKKVQEELYFAKIKSEENEKSLFEAQKITGLGSYSLDITAGYWNSSIILNKIFGINKSYEKDVNGWIQLIHPDDREQMVSYLEINILKNHEFFDKQYRIIKNDNKEVLWVHGFGKLTFDEKGNPIKLFGTIQDITESKRIQEELQKAKKIAEESEFRFKSLIEQAGDALYLNDLNGDILEVNNASINSSGYSREELLSMNVRDLDIEHQEISKLKEIWSNLTTDSPVTIESFHKRKDGTIFPIEIRICAIFLNGEKLIYGFARDVSARVKLFKENKLLSAAVEQSANSIFITDIEGNIQFTNPKFSDSTGFSNKEVIGKNPRVLNSGLLPKDYFKNLWETILKGETWHGEFQNKTKFGELIWERTTITPIKNNKGVISNFLAIKEDITEHKKAEIRLNTAYSKIKESEDYLKRILQTANEGFWIIDTKGLTKDVNLKMSDILGYSNEDFLKKSIFDFVDDTNAKIFKDQIELRKKGLSTSYEIELLKKNGKKVICLFKTSPIFNNSNEPLGSFALVTDVTSLKNASNKINKRNEELNELSIELFDKNKLLNESKNRYFGLFNHSPIAILEEDFSEVLKLIKDKNIKVSELDAYLDENFDFLLELIQNIKILKANTASLSMFGVKNLKGLIKHLRKTNTENSFKVLKNEILALASGQSEFIFETEFINAKGKKIIAAVKLAIIDKRGKVIATIIDITNVKKTESELRLSKEKAEESNRLKTEFLNNMSHEIRTPMNGILGFSELLGNSDLSLEKRNYFISIIQNSGKQLLRVIDDILEISRLGTKQVKVVESEVCLNDLLLELFSIFDLQAKEKGVPIYVKNELSDYESTIYTDKSKLEKIITNLLENALKFTVSGHITIGYNLVDDYVEIFVKDTGIGIMLDKQDIIFERFSQEQKNLTLNASGLGLGLSIAKENTELLGGKITVKSVKERGSIFKVKIPYKHVENINLEQQLSINDKPLRSKYKVLVVEDEEVNFLFIEILLVDKIKLNCDILLATNGEEAVELFTKNKDIDIVLMDINMPIMNGYEATKKIKEINSEVPIIAQTAYSTSEDKIKAFNAGCNDFISKPINKNELESLIENYLVKLKE